MHGRGRRFDSCQLHVQVAEWSNAVDCKSIIRRFESDPVLNMIDDKELAKYIKKKMKGCTVKGVHGKWLYVEEPVEDELEFWIQQFKTKDCCGHSEWSERFQQNIWIKD